MEPVAVPPSPAGVSLGAWLAAGWRTATFRDPGLARLSGGPSLAFVAVALAVLVGLGVAGQRLAIDGAAWFDRGALDTGWWSTVLSLGLCAFVAPPAVSATTLFALIVVKQVLLSCAWIASTVFLRLAFGSDVPEAVRWAEWLGFLGWELASTLVLFARVAARPRAAAAGVATLAAALVSAVLLPQRPYWIAMGETPERRFAVTDTVLEAQARLLDDGLAALAPQRPGTVDVYGITFAPWAGADVFRTESGRVADVLHRRFDAVGRTLELVNHDDTATTVPWATAAHLERAIAGAAKAMDASEDVLVLHLTSHGAADGTLATRHWPLELVGVTPGQLNHWLDAADVRHAVVSVSACYSGAWIEPLRGDGRLVVTAADATHTSYGCGLKSELTFFGRAFWDEGLRRTRSFERAHAEARTVIEQREREAGKTDGFSNPQIAVGERMRSVLRGLEERLDAAADAPR